MIYASIPVSDGVACPAPELLNKPLGTDGTLVFYWRDPAAPCAPFYARATSHPDPENAPDTSFEVVQPLISSRSVVPSAVRTGMILLGPITKSVIIAPNAPWTAIELFQNINPTNPS